MNSVKESEREREIGGGDRETERGIYSERERERFHIDYELV